MKVLGDFGDFKSLNPCIHREGLQKKTANYPHFVDKGRGTQMWISNGGGSPHVDKKKFLDMNIINFEKVDKP